MTRHRVLLCAALVAFGALLAIAARAGDEPHWTTFTVQCASCHATHKAAGSNLTTRLGNENLCASCHNLSGGLASTFPIERMNKANLAAETGSSHAWGVSATNSAAGATPPSNSAMSVRLDSGNIVCSTCHNQHSSPAGAVTAGTAGTQFLGTVAHVFGSGTGSVSYAAAAAANQKGYVLEVIETGGAAGTAKFRVSNDGGTSWWGYSGGNWVAYAPGNARLSGSNVLLNDGSNVSVTFTGATSGSFVLGDKWRFYVGYPFLRLPLDTASSNFCRDCHASWTMDHSAVESWTGAMRSHPVGDTLNANGASYDRSAPLDANGVLQAGDRDGNPTNDLKLAQDGTVQCFTCHGLHHADGNSQSVDTP